MTDKPKTGLGNSLLLQRTEKGRRPVAQQPKTPGRLERSSDSDAPPAPQEQVERPVEVVLPRARCTLYIDEDVNEQLSLVAGIEKRQRSEVVTEILRSHLPTYSVQRIDKAPTSDTPPATAA